MKPFALDNFRTLIWDLDGTILDSFKISLEIWTDVLEKRGIILDEKDLRRNYHGTLRDTAEAILGSNASASEVDQAVAEFLTKDNTYIKDVHQHLFIDAVGLIERAHKLGHRQLIVTNRAHGVDRGMASPRTLMASSKVSHCIDMIICGDEVEQRKPKAQVLQGLDYDSLTTLVIGDQHIDAQFAHNLNASALLVNRNSEEFVGLPGNHTVVESLDLFK